MAALPACALFECWKPPMNLSSIAARASSSRVLTRSDRKVHMKLSIVIICWNDLRVIRDCLRSIYEGTRDTSFEVIVSDNGSVDGSVEFVRKHYPAARVV